MNELPKAYREVWQNDKRDKTKGHWAWFMAGAILGFIAGLIMAVGWALS